jgi:hypothetical protein
MIACIREEFVTEDQSKLYLEQVAANQTYIRRYETSPRALSVTYQLAQMAASQPRQHEYLGSARRMFVATSAALHTDFLVRTPSCRLSRTAEMHSNYMTLQ